MIRSFHSSFLHVPEEKYDYFSEFSPIFCNTSIPYSSIGKHMQEHSEKFNLSKRPRRLLIGGMKAKKILLATDLLKWYIQHGLVVTVIHQVVEYLPSKCFSHFVKDVSDGRRKADLNQDDADGENWKLVGNAAYGTSIMNKEKHLNIKYIKGENNACMYVNNPKFKHLSDLDKSLYEIESFKKKITMDVPLQIGFIILQLAKLKMLSFYYDCLDKYLERDDFELIQMDTDSLYFAISKHTLRDVIKPDLIQDYDDSLNSCEDSSKSEWFPRICCNEHATFDKRTPGLFKLEFSGNEMIALCSKTYIINNDEKSKFSCKGINKRNVTNVKDIYKDVLETQEPYTAKNVGFKMRDNSVFTYSMLRNGFTYFYCKREVLEDGIHTMPLDITLSP